MVYKTLKEMRKGGIYDHLGYGFHSWNNTPYQFTNFNDNFNPLKFFAEKVNNENSRSKQKNNTYPIIKRKINGADEFLRNWHENIFFNKQSEWFDFCNKNDKKQN